jgi:uncharacterized protein with ATP-grasp and redox domains
MKTYLDCIPCFVNQALRAGYIATGDEHKIKALLDEVGSRIREIPMTCTPPETGEYIYRRVREVTGVEDPYSDIKRKSIREVLSLLPRLRDMVFSSDDRLLAAIRLATIGNVIDFGIQERYDLMEEIGKMGQMNYAIFHYSTFREQLDRTDEVLFIGDNAGESVFDRLLIEEIGKPVTYVVREGPVINDATREDAIESGLHEVATIVSSGSTAPGTILRLCTAEFIDMFRNAGMVISKGQGNYEGLSESDQRVFFLLRAKCPIIARDIGVKMNDFVLLDSSLSGQHL